MFTSTYTIQMPKGTMLFLIVIKCRQLNEQDEPINFNINEACHQWWLSDDSKEYKTTPHALCLGVWLMLSKHLKQTNDAQARDVIIHRVKLDAPGLSIEFGVDTH